MSRSGPAASGAVVSHPNVQATDALTRPCWGTGHRWGRPVVSRGPDGYAWTHCCNDCGRRQRFVTAYAPYSEMLTVAQVAQRLGVHWETANRLLGRLGLARTPAGVRLRPEDIDTLRRLRQATRRMPRAEH